MARKRRGSAGRKCPCEKVCFSQEGAEEALLNAKIARALRHSQKRKEIRIYGDCPCGHWHLTSKENIRGSDNGMREMRSQAPDDSAGREVLPHVREGSLNEGSASGDGIRPGTEEMASA